MIHFAGRPSARPVRLQQFNRPTLDTSALMGHAVHGQDNLEDSFQRKANSTEQLAWIRNEITQCQYGWAWDWLKPLSSIPLKQLPDGIQLNHPIHPDKPGHEMNGDCITLAYKLGNRLAEKYKGQYQFYVAEGNFPNSPWEEHFFIVGWPPTQDKAMRQQIGERLGEIPPQVLIVDPSYGLADFKQNGVNSSRLNSYIVETSLNDTPLLAPLPQKDPKKKDTKHHFLPYKFLKMGATESSYRTPALPLGFMNQLAPQSNEYRTKPNALAIIQFEKQQAHKNPRLLVSVIDATDESQPSKNHPDWRQAFPRLSPMYRVLAKLDRTLKRPHFSLFQGFKTHDGNKPNPRASSANPVLTPFEPFNHFKSPPSDNVFSTLERPEIARTSPPTTVAHAPVAVRLKWILQKADGPSEQE